MPKGGALKSVYPVAPADLRVNGGKWILQQGPALKVRGFTSDTVGSRKIKGGDALPVYIVPEADLEINGGRWKVFAGEPVQVTDVIGATRGIIQGHAIPVMPVDANGDYDPLWGSYAAKVLSYNPVAYWPLWETEGLVANDISGNDFHGTYKNVTLGQGGIGDGNPSPYFDGNNSVVDVYSLGLNAIFPGDVGSFGVWGKAFNAGIWLDGNTRYIGEFRTDADDYINLNKKVDNLFRFRRVGGGVSDFIDLAITPVIYTFYTITWDLGNNTIEYYVAGTSAGSDVGLAAWGGALLADRCTLGATVFSVPGNEWNGWIAHSMLFDFVLSPAQITNLGTT